MQSFKSFQATKPEINIVQKLKENDWSTTEYNENLV